MMILPRREDAYHKMQLFRLLTVIIDDEELASRLCFKGGTCAAMLGFLDRFSVDLDFDLAPDTNREKLKDKLHQIFMSLDLEIKDESQATLLFFLRYEAEKGQRNTLKLDAVDEKLGATRCEPQFLAEVDRYMICQTIESMFANKLVALIDRYEKNNSIAGRDLYDIHHFFGQGYRYQTEIIVERRGVGTEKFLRELRNFIEDKITQTIIDQDLNTVLPHRKFQQIREVIKQEVLVMLNDELKRLEAG